MYPALSNTSTMSSREVSELCNTPHDSVLKTVRDLIKRGVVFGNETLYKHKQNGQMYPEFLLSFRDSMIVTSGYSPELRARIIDRWQELEAKEKTSPIADPQIAAMVVMLQNLDQVKQTQAKQQKILQDQSERLDEMEARTDAVLDGSGFYSVAGFASLHGIKVDIKAAASYGRKAASESKLLGIAMGSIPDPRFGTVKTYHEDVLKHVFALE